MGRRKQSNPLRVSGDPLALSSTSTTPSTTPSKTASPCSSSISDATSVKKTDFSIKTQLDTKPSTSAPINPSLSPHSLENALKAYNALIKDVEKQGNLLQLTRDVNMLARTDRDFKPKGFDFALDLRVKRKPHDHSNSRNGTAKTPRLDREREKDREGDGDTLMMLSSLVGKAGSSMNASMAAVVKSSVADTKEETDPRHVFTCLKCFERFNGMEELSEHMVQTKHFGSNSASNNNNNIPSNSSKQLAQHMNSLHHLAPRSMSMFNGAKPAPTSQSSSRVCSYRYKCALCGFCNDSKIDEHMKKQHSFKEPKDWIAAVKLVPI